MCCCTSYAFTWTHANRFRQSSNESRRRDPPHLLTPIHELEHSELFSFAETVLREIDVDRHLEVFRESFVVSFKDRRGWNPRRPVRCFVVCNDDAPTIGRADADGAARENACPPIRVKTTHCDWF